MTPQEALAIFEANVPAEGIVPYEDVYNAMQATPQGRQALSQVHSLRRNPAMPLYFKINRNTGALHTSRVPFPDGWGAKTPQGEQG